MSKKIDESFLKAFAGNMAAYVAGRALAANGDKIKQALGIDSKEFDDVDAEMAAVKKAQDRLSDKLEKRMQALPPDEQAKIAARIKKLDRYR